MKRLLIASIGLIALVSAAAAADLTRPAPYYPKAPVLAPVYNWTGFYIGVNGGGGWGSSNWDSLGRFDVSGGLVGGTIGYNYQVGKAVFGVEGDIDWSDINGTTATALCPLTCKTANDWLSTIRGRIGYAADRFMPYVTGGVAFGSIKATAPGFAGATNTNAGWTLGGGIEAAIVGNWTGKVEYLYADLGNSNCGFSCGTTVSNNVSFRTSILRAGLNYKF